MSTLTRLEKWSYAVGNVPFAVKDAAFVNFVVFYYTQVEGLSGALTGLAMLVALTWDAISDPVVGSWSDTVRSRWGRRHPLILIGGLPTALLFIAVFSPPDFLGESGLFVWLAGSSILLRTFLTINYIPYSAMGAELSPDYDERTEIAKARVTTAWVAGMAMPALAFMLIFTTQDGSDGRLVSGNYDTYGLLSCVLVVIATLVCVWGTRTVIPRLPTADDTGQTLHWKRILSDLRQALSNRNFRLFIACNLAFMMAAGVYTTLGLYLGTYFWEFSTDQLAGLVVPTALGTFAAFFVLGKLGERYDKPVLLSASAFGVAFNALWFIALRLLDLLPENGDPMIYALQWLNTALAIFSIVSLQIIGASLTADILDEQEIATGLRQEGVFFAASNFIGKATTGMGTFIAGLVVDFAGISPGSEPGEVPAQILTLLGGFTMGITFTLAIIASLFTLAIQLSRKDHERIRLELAERRSLSS
ncbi:MAG: MFS transporter [Pseudomonadota bacterium]